MNREGAKKWRLFLNWFFIIEVAQFLKWSILGLFFFILVFSTVPINVNINVILLLTGFEPRHNWSQYYCPLKYHSLYTYLLLPWWYIGRSMELFSRMRWRLVLIGQTGKRLCLWNTKRNRGSSWWTITKYLTIGPMRAFLSLYLWPPW